jgi:dihydrofolate reductase
MKKLVLFMHTSLDGFVAGPNGEMNWINVKDEIFDEAAKVTGRADTALYGRKTYGMMEGYWPTAGDQPKASKHDIEHSKWYNSVTKIVISKTMEGTQKPKTKVISHDLAQQIKKIKQGPGKDIVIFGSPSTCHSLMQDNLIDEYILSINPVLLGAGIPLFKGIENLTKLKLRSSKVLDSAVVLAHYQNYTS